MALDVSARTLRNIAFVQTMGAYLMAVVTFAKAARKGAHVIITAYGESGSGKTYSLIKLARGLVGPNGKVGMIDTETGRGLIYANVGGGYDYAELTPPFTPERYIEAIDAAEEAGIEALIIDSGSLEWEGLGGVLEIADNNNLKGLVKWAGPKARHKRYVQRLLNSRMHLLISLRAKEKMVQLTDKMPIPQGMKIGDIISAGYTPIQDKRFIFETTVQLFLPVSTDRRRLGIPIVEKCPEDLWGAFPEGEHISEETGRKIAEWVSGGVPVDHAFESAKRAAEAAAADGTEALRDHWRELDQSMRRRLAELTDNLASIARGADRDNEERRQEREQSHRQFRPSSETPQEAAGAPEASDPYDGTPATEQPHSAPRGGDAAPFAGPAEREGDATSTEPSPGPSDIGERDLLGGTPAEDLVVRLPRNPSIEDCAYFHRQMLAMLNEQPRTRQRLASIKLANEWSLKTLKNVQGDLYQELMSELARKP